MDLSLEQRLLRFLWREEEGEQRSHRDLRALPIAERVLEGECIQSARLIERVREKFVFDVQENLSKYRLGDTVMVGDGEDPAEGVPLQYRDFDAEEGRLSLEPDPFVRGEPELELCVGEVYCVDRRPLGLRGRLQDVVQAGFADARIHDALEGRLQPDFDEARMERAREALAERGLNDTQLQAGVEAIAAEHLALIQGPPGTGKTRLVAEVLRVLCNAGCRIALSAFTHRAVDNVLLALRKLDSKLPLIKLGARNNDELHRAGIRATKSNRNLPPKGVVIAGTCFALAKLRARETFHFTVFDEAGQLPIPHAIAGMLLSQRWIFVGDHQQLPPVITSHHADRSATLSVFEHLHKHYGSRMLDLTYRMNDQICDVIGDSFYGARLKSAVADRRMPFQPGGKLDDVLDPEKSVVLARIDHLQPGMRSGEEANLVADLVDDLRRQHEVPPEEIAVVTPFRAQVRAIRSALQKKVIPDENRIVVDTVERMQGQEREVIIVSLAVGDTDSLNARSSFFFSTNRINVALSRARSKAILVASQGVFRALPMDPHSLRAASLFKRLFQRLPQVDLTRVYSG